MKRIKIIVLSLSLVLLSTLVFVGAANASSFKTGDSITVAAGETVDSMLFTAGNNINIAGTVNGDVYCAGQTINISGVVKGDVNCAGQTITVSGTIEGSLKLAGQSINISGLVGGSATIAGQSLTIDKSGVIARDLLGGSQNLTINGNIKRDVLAGSNILTVNGIVGRNVQGGAKDVTVESAGQIGGNLDYTSDNDPTIASGSIITGTITRTAPTKDSSFSVSPQIAFFSSFIYILIAGIIVSLALASLFPRILNEATTGTIKKPGITFLAGTIGVFLVPIAIVILLMTIIGAPLALLTMTIWAVVLILSTPFAGYVLGRIILKKSKQPIVIMLLGVSILIVTYFIPIVGFITSVAALMFGTGSILVQSKKLFARSGKK